MTDSLRNRPDERDRGYLGVSGGHGIVWVRCDQLVRCRDQLGDEIPKFCSRCKP